jgi:toxin YoeB
MRIIWSRKSWDEYDYWLRQDMSIALKINDLVRDVRRNPFHGIGKPEPLKSDWHGWWSRRITEEHRLIYRVIGPKGDQQLEIAQCRYHYRSR